MPRGLAPPREPLTDREIRLQPIDDSFAPHFEALLSDPAIVSHTRVPSEPPPGFGQSWVVRYTQGWKDGSRAGFAIVSFEDEFLGMAAIVELDLDGRQGEIGYLVVPTARGRGVAGRALRLVTDWALGDLGLERVELRIDVENEPSHRVAERVGYVKEGVLRSLHFKEDVRKDVAIYSLIRSDRHRRGSRSPWKAERGASGT
jgi:RimJ/RimL family protein N-acetyltransferase